MVRNIYPEPICIDHIEQVIYNNSAPQVEHLLHNDLLLDVLQVYGIRMLVRRFFYAIKEGGEYYVSFRPHCKPRDWLRQPGVGAEALPGLPFQD